MQAVSYAEVEPNLYRHRRTWKIDLLGKKLSETSPDPQAFRLDMDANMTLDSHFHFVDQFQVFIAGSGTIGRDNVQMVLAHYADHHTGYGPLVAGPQGMSYLTLRSKTDSGAVMLSTPNVRDHLKPTKRRHRVSTPVILSVPPVMREISEPIIERVMEQRDGDDGMSCWVIRLGRDMKVTGFDPALGGGQYLIVLNGTLIYGGKRYTPFSLIFVDANDPAPELVAADFGVELMVTQFPQQDSWMASL